MAPTESGVIVARHVWKALAVAGELGDAGCTPHADLYFRLDCAPTLDDFLAEVQAGVLFARRTGSSHYLQHFDSYRWLAGVLRGDGAVEVGVEALTDPSVHPLARLIGRLTRAIVAAVLSDPGGLAQHSAAAVRLLSSAVDPYLSAEIRVLRGLSLAQQVRTGNPDGREGVLAELNQVTRALAARAEDAPADFRHLSHLVDAERAWALGDFLAALLAFDSARSEVATGQRPWHQALITESAARFHLAHGLEHTGIELLAQAQQQYRAWGAEAKVVQLARESAVPGPQSDADSGRSDYTADDHRWEAHPVTTGNLDLLGVLSASQALSSQTEIRDLHTRVVEVLLAMTGATGVQLLLWNEDRQDWLRLTPEGAVTPTSEHDVPLRVLRHVRRTGEPLVVSDASSEGLFSRDPYFAGLDRRSVLAVPVHGRGIERRVLLLENRLIRGAFTNDRLEVVKLIAGQLAISLDNAQLYGELTTSRARIVAAADQTRRRIEQDLHDGAQQRLVSLALRLGATQAALGSSSGRLAAQLHMWVSELTSTLEELRELARGIHPIGLAESGLYPALEELAHRSAVPVELTVDIDERPPDQVEVAVYYVVSEALTNVARHAQASMVRVEVGVEARPGTVVLQVEISDDGHGGAGYTRGTGLLGLKDRVEALGGRIVLRSTPEAGTTLRAELPFTPNTAPPPFH